MVSPEEGIDEVASGELQQIPSPDRKFHTIQKLHDDGVHASEKRGITPFINSKQCLEDTDGVHISELDKEGSIASTIPGEISQAPSTGSQAVQSQEGKPNSNIREKVSEDGYHWRKYGQKLVKGNEFIRSYYKCTHPSCQVKKQLECSHIGQIANIVYFGEHDHPKPQSSLPLAVGFVFSVVEERVEDTPLVGREEVQAPHLVNSTSNSQISTVTSTGEVKGVPSESNRMRDEMDNDEDQHSKRQKKNNRIIGPIPADKSTGEPRLVVQTLSDVDIVNDGYRWRKYGQKLVKGNPNPRSYYRCSSLGCPVKKHVERASHDSKVVITSYEGQHDHDLPPSRTVTHNGSGQINNMNPLQNAESGGKSGELLNVAVDNSSSTSVKLKKQLNGKSRNKSKENVVPKSDTIKEEQNGKSSLERETDSSGPHTVVNANRISDGTSNELHNGKSRPESPESSPPIDVHNITPDQESHPVATNT
ncbi:hypothetical protein K2173_018502 [Erythroxylum novogranatense]|uniref:WRKY domain-containing protein n=1 Tax=Erythroxylum novogranatense TaxID=1862640 RepID=A0AAV8UEM9_9ROSI|nr:hypothetical protein K2173_018502 [Erythroxylum novogranatense]